MDAAKTIIFLQLLLVLLAGTGHAIQIDMDRLDVGDLNKTYNSTHICLEDHQISNCKTAKSTLIPNLLEDDLGSFDSKYDSKNGSQVKYQIKYQFAKEDPDGDLPQTLLGAKYDQKMDLKEDEEKTDLKTSSGKINTTVRHHQNKIIYEYEIINDNGDVVQTYQDIEKAETQKVAFSGQVKKIGEDKYQQKISRDRLYTENSKEEVMNIVKPEDANLSIDFGNISNQECNLDYFQYSRPELQNAGVNSSLILDDLYQKSYNCYNLTLPADQVSNITVNFTYDHTETSSGEFRVRETPEFYTYIIGSGGAMKTTGSRELCGELTNDNGNYYDNIVIEGTITLTCDSTIKANNIIDMNGWIDGSGEDGEDQPDGTSEPGGDGTNGYSITLDANRIEQSGIIYLDGGDGGDGSNNEGGGEGGTRGGDAGNAGSVTVNAYRYITQDDIWVEGGTGGEGGTGDPYGPSSGRGGHGGDAGNIDINTQYFKVNGYLEFETFGGDGGEGGYGFDQATKNDGGDAGNAGKITINSYETIIDNLYIDGKGGKGGRNGENTVDPGQDGTKGSIIDATSTILNISDSNFNIDGGDGGWTEDDTAGKGGQGGDVYLDYEKFKIENTDIYARGGDGGDARQYDDFHAQAGAGGDGGYLRTRTYDQTITDNLFNASGGDGGDGNERNDGDAGGGDGGNGGTIKVIYRDTITNAFNDLIVYGGLGGEGDHDDGADDDGTDGADGTVDITQDTSLSLNTQSSDTDLEWNNYQILSQDGGYSGEIPERRNITVVANFTIDTEIPNGANLSIYDRTDNATVYNQSMTQVSKTNNGAEYTYVYEYDYDIPQITNSSGEWFTEIRIEDGYGNTYTNSETFIYQYKGRNIQNAIQGEARVGQPIRFDQDITVTNPSGTNYHNPVLIRFPLIDSVVLEDTAIRASDGSAIESNTFTLNGQNYVQWNASGLGAGQSKTFGVVWYMNEIIVQEDSGVEETDSGRSIANQDFTFKNPSNDTSLTDVQLQAEFYSPERTVEAQLFTDDGEDITNSETYGTYFSDEDLDGFTDTANWEVESLIPGNPKKYSLVTDLGKPIKVYREPLITNRPVEPGKPIKWRIGYAFLNKNSFNVPYTYRMRVPLDASNIRLQGQLKDQRFDNLGPYVLFERNLDSNTNSTAFLRYETRSISAPPINTQRADRNFIGEGAEVKKTVVIENLVDQKIRNVKRTVNIDYGEDVSVVDVEEENEIDSKDVVRDGYTITVPELEANENKEIQVGYRIPIGEKKVVREGQAEGYQLKVWEVNSEVENPVDNVYFRTKDIDCSEVHEVRVVSDTDQNIQDGTLVEDWECGSTIVPLGTLNSGETVRIGITYKKTDTEIETNPGINLAVGIGKWILLIGGLIALIEGSTRLMNKINIQPPWRQNNGR